jgi:hypothetical protein
VLRVRLNIRARLYLLTDYILATLAVLLRDLGLEVEEVGESAYVIGL